MGIKSIDSQFGKEEEIIRTGHKFNEAKKYTFVTAFIDPRLTLLRFAILLVSE